MEKFLTWNLVIVTRLVRFGTVGAVRTITTINHKEIFNRGSTDFSQMPLYILTEDEMYLTSDT